MCNCSNILTFEVKFYKTPTRNYILPMKTTFTIFALFLSLCLSAQDTLTNYGLNSWESSGKQPPFDWEEPIGWTSSNSLTEFISAGVTKTQIPQSGSLQAQIKTLNVFGQNVPGLLFYGDFPVSISDTARIPLLGGEPMTTVKSMAYGLYNFTSSDTTDSATIIIAFKKFNTSTQKPEAVAIGSISLAQTQAGLYPFIIDIQSLSGDTPDSVAVTMVSTGTQDFKTGGILTVDFVQFTQPLSVNPIIPSAVSIYPNPAQNEVFIELPNANSVGYTNYTIIDILGKQITTGTIAHNSLLQKINVANLNKGYYFIALNNANETKTFKFIKE